MQETWTRQVTKIAKLQVVGHALINTILQVLQKCVVTQGRWPTPQACLMYRGAYKSLARPGRKEACQGHAISTSRCELLSSFFFFLQGKALKEIHAILTETLACFLPGQDMDLSAPL